MNDNAALVVEALRSGDYQQDTGTLRTEKGFCCLGVVCDIYHRETGLGNWNLGEDNHYYSFVIDSSGVAEARILPLEVREWIGFNTRSGRFDPNSVFDGTLTALNDSGASFPEIADKIETTPDLFVS
jgi:hypothetical protein